MVYRGSEAKTVTRMAKGEEEMGGIERKRTRKVSEGFLLERRAAKWDM